MAVFVVLWCAAPAVRADESPPPAPAPTAPLLPRIHQCIDEGSRARALQVEAARRDPNAFQQSGIWLPPFFMTDAERSYTWAGLLYFSVFDFDADTRTRALLPFGLSLCAPESDTLITPVYSYRHDADGTAGFVLNYFWRRDRLAETDVLFPLFWSIRERASETAEFGSSSGALFPFIWWGHGDGGTHHLLAPPVFLNWGDAQESTSVVLNTYWHTTPSGYDLGVVPFYFRGRGPDRHYDLIPPLLFYRSESPEGTTTWFANTYYRSRADGFTLASIPLVFVMRSPESHYTLVPPLLFEWGDATESTLIAGTFYSHHEAGTWKGGLAPLWFAGSDAQSRWDLIPPLLLFREVEPTQSTYFALQTYYQSRPNGFTLGSFPFVFAGREGNDHFALIPPLLTFHSGDGTTETTVVANTYYRQTPQRTDLGVVPFYFHGREGDAYYDFAPPLFWRWGDLNQHWLLAGPYLAQTDPTSWTRALLPLWIAYGSPSSRTDWIPPLLLYRNEEGSTATYFALQTYFQSRPDGYTLASLPLVFAGKDYQSNYLVVPPLVWHFGDEHGSTTLVGNTYYVSRPTGYDLGVMPLYFRGRHGDDHYDFVPPLYWHWGDATSDTTIVTTGYYHPTSDGYDLGIAPLYFRGRHQDRFYDIAPPFFARWGDRGETLALFLPGYYFANSTSFDAGVIPFWFGGSDSDSRYDVIPPLLFYRKRTPDRLKLFVINTWYESSASDFTLASIPFLFAWGGGQEHHVLVPPALTYHGGDGVSETTYAVQTYYHSDPSGYDLGVMPFYFRGRHGADHYDFAPPLFWNWGDSTSSTTIATTAYYSTRPTGFDAGVLPFWAGGSNGPERYDLIPPLLFYRSSTPERLRLFAVNTWYESTGSDYTLASVPFLFAGREGSSSYTFVPPLFWRWGDYTGHTTIVGNVLYHHGLEGYDLAVAPLYFRGRDTAGGYYDFAPPLFWRWGDPTRTSMIAGPVITHSDPLGWEAAVLPFWIGGTEGSQHFDLIPPLLFYRSTDGADSTVFAVNTLYKSHGHDYSLTSFPLLFAGREGTATHLVVPPLYFDFRDGDAHTQVIGNFYRSSDSTGWSAGVVPFWFGGRHGDQEYDVVPPLVLRTQDGVRNRLTVLPLFDYRSGPAEKQILSLPFIYSTDADHERTEVLGMYWHFTGPDSDDRVIFPFWWDFRNKETNTRLTTVFPFFWRYEKPDETTHLLLNVMWSSGMTPQGPSWSFHLFPVVDLVSYHPHHFLWQVLGGLVGAERQGDMHRSRFAWIWTDPKRDGEQ